MAATDFFAGEDKPSVAAAVTRAFAEGASEVDAELRTADGRGIPHAFTARRTMIEGRTLIVGVGIDVSARRRAEEAQVREHARLNTLVHTIPDLVWLKDPDGVYLSCNPKFEQLYGHREAEIVGRTDYDFVDRDLADFFRAHDRAAAEAGRPCTNEEWLTFADGQWSGCNMFYLATPAALGVIRLWRRIEAERKRPWRMAWILGPGMLMRFALGRLQLGEAVGRLGKLARVSAAIVESPDGLAAVDVDKPADLDLVRRLVGS